MALYRVRTIFTGPQGSPWLSTMHFGDTGGSAQQAVTAVGAFWGAVDVLMPITVDWTTEADVSVVNLDGTLAGVTATTPATGSGGAGAAELLPPATQGLVQWRTGVIVASRELRGRTFIPGLADGSNDQGTFLLASRTTVNTAAAALISDANSILSAYSRVHNSSAVVVTGVAQPEFAVLRSRRD